MISQQICAFNFSSSLAPALKPHQPLQTEENKTEANRTDSPSVPGSNSALIQPKSPIYVKSLIQPRILDQTNVTAMATR